MQVFHICGTALEPSTGLPSWSGACVGIESWVYSVVGREDGGRSSVVLSCLLGGNRASGA